MRDSKGDTDVKNSFVDSVGEGEGGMIWEKSIGTSILSYVKWIASPGSVHETGCSGLLHWDDPEEWDGEGGRREGCSRWGKHVHPWLKLIFLKNYIFFPAQIPCGDGTKFSSNYIISSCVFLGIHSLLSSRMSLSPSSTIIPQKMSHFEEVCLDSSKDLEYFTHTLYGRSSWRELWGINACSSH